MSHAAHAHAHAKPCFVCGSLDSTTLQTIDPRTLEDVTLHMCQRCISNVARGVNELKRTGQWAAIEAQAARNMKRIAN